MKTPIIAIVGPPEDVLYRYKRTQYRRFYAKPEKTLFKLLSNFINLSGVSFSNTPITSSSLTQVPGILIYGLTSADLPLIRRLMKYQAKILLVPPESIPNHLVSRVFSKKFSPEVFLDP